MSPSESQLRAALQDGEGDAPDASLLISHALRVRRDRRQRITSIAGGVAVVAVVGVGLTALIGSGTDSGGSGGSAMKADSAAGGSARSDRVAGAATPAAKAPSVQHSSAAASAAVPAPYRAEGTAADALTCPATPARYMLPGGGGSGQFGSSDPLFASPVAAMKVCGYPAGTGAHPQAHVYRQAAARKIVTALESAPTTHTSHMCADNSYLRGTVEILAVDAKGNPLKPVVITLNCQASQTTNGTAVRFVNAVPDQLTRLVH